MVNMGRILSGGLIVTHIVAYGAASSSRGTGLLELPYGLAVLLERRVGHLQVERHVAQFRMVHEPRQGIEADPPLADRRMAVLVRAEVVLRVVEVDGAQLVDATCVPSPAMVCTSTGVPCDGVITSFSAAATLASASSTGFPSALPVCSVYIACGVSAMRARSSASTISVKSCSACLSLAGFAV